MKTYRKLMTVNGTEIQEDIKRTRKQREQGGTLGCNLT